MGNIQLTRNTRLWATTALTQAEITPSNTQEILIQDDFSFSQDSNQTDISLSEAGPRPTRGSARYTDSLNPAEWSFSTYLRPYLDTTSNQVVTADYFLWHSVASGSEVNLSDSNGVQANGTNMLVNFTDNQHHELSKLTLYYLVDKEWFRIENVQINSAEITLDIDSIGLTAWSGQGTNVIPLATAAPFDPNSADYALPDSVFNAAPYIRNRLTQLIVRDNEDGDEYSIPVTGGSLSINNNITYLTPSTLSRLDKPIGSFTGAFDVTGSLEAYLRRRDPVAPGDTEDPNAQDRAAELLNKLIASNDITNSHTLAISFGGIYTLPAPAVVAVLPTAHLSIPTIETGDILSTTIEFKGIPTKLDSGNEMYFGMSPAYTRDQINSLIQSGDGATVLVPRPVISSQPVAQDLNISDTLTLTVTGTNIDTVQWYLDDSAISGATSETYTVASVTTEDAGDYRVEVFNSESERTISNTVEITVT